MKDTTTYPNSVAQLSGKAFRLYPNPNNGTFTLEITDHFKTGMVQVYDVIGRTVYQSGIDQGSSIIQLGGQPRGIYMVKVQLDDAVLTKQVMVE